MAPTRMKLSVVIVNWNTGGLLRACLRSLAGSGIGPEGGAEVIVVDNASSDGSAEMVREEFPEVVLLVNSANLRYAAGNNQGLRLARGEAVLLLNSDTEVPAGAVETLLAVLEAHPEAGAVAPRLVQPAGVVQASVRGFPTPGALLGEVLGLAALFPRSRRLGAYRMRYWALDDERDVDQPMMSCLLVRRAVLEQVGHLDESFPMFFNDVDWCYRAWRLGWHIRFTPHAHVLHHGGASTSQVRREMIRESGRSLACFYRKHYRGRIAAPLYALSLLAIRLGTALRIANCELRIANCQPPSDLRAQCQPRPTRRVCRLEGGPADPSPSLDTQGSPSLGSGGGAGGQGRDFGFGISDFGSGIRRPVEPSPSLETQDSPSLGSGGGVGGQGRGGGLGAGQSENDRQSEIQNPKSEIDLLVSVVNWNTRDDLLACLHSIYQSIADCRLPIADTPAGCEANPKSEIRNPKSYVVAVVDNASSDGSADRVAECFPQAVLVRNHRNLGFAAAHNQVLKGSRSRYVFVLNPDTQTHPGALDALVRFMDENPAIGICGPLVLNPDGSVQYSARRFPTLLAGAFRNTFLGRLFPNNRYTRDYLLSDWDHRSQRDVDWLSGAAMVIRREVIDQVGILDERFFMYSEDVDLCYRAHEAGWRVTFYPGAAITHARAHSSDQAQLRMLVQFHRSMYRFWRKHYAPRSSLPMRVLAPLGIGLRLGLVLGRNLTDRVRGKLGR